MRIAALYLHALPTCPDQRLDLGRTLDTVQVVVVPDEAAATVLLDAMRTGLCTSAPPESPARPDDPSARPASDETDTRHRLEEVATARRRRDATMAKVRTRLTDDCTSGRATRNRKLADKLADRTAQADSLVDTLVEALLVDAALEPAALDGAMGEEASPIVELLDAGTGPVPVLVGAELADLGDAGARSALVALGELAALTQVIVVAPEDRVVEMARAALGSERADVIPAGPRRPEAARQEVDVVPPAVRPPERNGSPAIEQDARALVLRALEVTDRLEKHDVIAPTGISDNLWAKTIRALAVDGTVERDDAAPGSGYRPSDPGGDAVAQG